MKLAIVVQRYGPEVIGGAENLCRELATRFSRHWSVEVLTTCAKDFVTWSNEYPAGEQTVDGVTVRRFPVDNERGIGLFEDLVYIFAGESPKVYPQNKLRIDRNAKTSPFRDQERWIKKQGPFSTAIFDYLRQNQESYDLFLFFSYLYPLTLFGSALVPQEKIVLLPTLHDEPIVNFPVFQKLFDSAHGIIFLTPEERDFARKNFKLVGKETAVIGMGLNETVDQPFNGSKKSHKEKPHILYLGRIDDEKRCSQLISFFLRYINEYQRDLNLVLAGQKEIYLPDDKHLVHLGRLSEKEKGAALDSALVFVQPSPYESFSITLLEAFSHGTPALVNAECAVTTGHCLRSNAGLYYRDYEEFALCLEALFQNTPLRKKMGENGRTYVQKFYRWQLIEERYSDFLDSLLK